MLHYFTGEDSYAARLGIEDIAVKAKARLHWLDLEHIKNIPPREWMAQAVSLFDKKILVVRQMELLPKATQEALISAIPDLATSPGIMILWETGVSKLLKLKRALKPYTTEFVLPPPAVLVTWLQAEAQKKGSELSPHVAKAIIDRAGFNRWVLLNELEKLTLQHAQITVEAVHSALPEHIETTIFSMLDYVTRGNQRASTEAMEQLLLGGAGELYILSMIAYQFRTVLTIRQALDRTGNVLPEETGLKPFVIQKNIPIARRFSASQLLDILTRILATDFAIKQGTVEPRTALWLLITTLTGQVQSTVRA